MFCFDADEPSTMNWYTKKPPQLSVAAGALEDWWSVRLSLAVS